MSTSLAEQLQRLALPQTSALKHSKKKASLLFDSKEAAGFKRGTIYQIGLEGLEELIVKNSSFEQFSNSLFSLSSRDFERSVQTIDVNNKLNKNISKFLLLASPYFMLNSTHKALEWLINRYSIHEYNRDELLKLILPYHESNIFVRVLQLLKFRDTNDSFYFLKELQRPGVHLPKQSLLNHAVSNTGFLKFVTEYMMQLLKVHDKPNVLTTAFNFYCAVFTGALEYSHNIKEEQVSHILPLLLKGLNSPISDFCAASYVILARLLTKCSLSDRLLDRFVEKISDLKVQGLKTESILIVIVLYQSQKAYKNLPPQAVANFSEKEWLPKILEELNSSGSYIYPFLEQLMKRSSEEGMNNDLKLARMLVGNCLDGIKMDDSFIPVLLKCVLDSLRPKTKYSSEATDWIIEIIQTLERQYPNAFDKEVYKILSTGLDKKTIKRKKCLTKILKNTMTYKGKYAIIDKLYNPNPELRGEALKYLKENYSSLRETDQEIIKNSFIDRLNDENVKVVQETLVVIERSNIVDKTELQQGLVNLLGKCKRLGTEWDSIARKVLNMLLNSSDPNDWEIFIVIFPYLFPDSQEELKFCKKLLRKDYFSKHPICKSFVDKFLSAHDHSSFQKLILKSLQFGNSADNLTTFLQVLKRVDKDKRTVHFNYISFLILSSLLPKNSSLEIGTSILETLQVHTDLSLDSFNTESTIVQYIEAAANFKWPLHGYLQSVLNIIKKIKKPQDKLSLRDLSDDSSETKFFLFISNMLFSINDGEKYGVAFLDYFCPVLQEKVDFLLNVCICSNKILSTNLIPKILLYLIKLLKEKEPEEVKQFIYIEHNTTVFLLILLCHLEDSIRVQVFELIEWFMEISTKKSGSYYFLLEGLKKYKEEIMMDWEQVPLVLFNILDPTNTKGKKHVVSLNSIRNHIIKMFIKEEYSIYIKAGILKLTSHIHSFDILEETSKMSMKILTETSDDVRDFRAQILLNTVNRIEAKIIKNMNLDSQTWKFIETAVRNDKTPIIIEESNRITPSPLVLNHLDKEVFKVIEENVEAKLLDIIIEISSIAQNPEILPAASKIFKHIDLNAKLVLDQLKRMKEVQSPKVDVSKRKSRGNLIPTVDILDTLEWKKGITILEFIQDKKKIRNFNCLLPAFFDILKKCLDFDEQVAVEYPKQLLLSSILHCCEKSEEELPEKVFNMELIVQCIRVSQNPQTHHHALLVLAHTAQLIPNQVLHHMMTIFTFMGSSVLRHDDAYSFQIITKIINTIIPILVQDNQDSKIGDVLRVFVDILLDVPEHRRMPMYQQLLEKINAKEHLYLFLLLVFESQVLIGTNQKQVKEIGLRRLEIAADLCRTFSPEIVIYTSIKLMKYLQKLPDEKEEMMNVESAFSIATHTPKDFRHFKYILIKFIANLLGSQEFVKQVAELSENDELNLESLFKEMIIDTLQYLQKLSKVVDKNNSNPQGQYWKVILNLSYDTLDSVNALVTPQMFLLVTKGLMVHNLSTIRRRILELLNSKLQYDPQFFGDCDKNEILSLVSPIIGIIEKLNDGVEQEQEIIVQTALLSLKLLVKSLAQENPTKFIPILEFVTNLIKSGKAQNNVLASLVLCIAEMCVNLRAHALSNLPEFMPAIIKILKQQKREETPSVLLRSVITTIEKILDSLPLFLSPYLQKLLMELSLLIAKWNLSVEDNKLQPFAVKISNIKEKLGSVIPMRVLLPAVEECYKILVQKKAYFATGELMIILSGSLHNLNGPDLNNNLQDLTNFFLNVLKFRTECGSSSDCDSVEDNIIKTFSILILKLSESSFRPIYYKLYDWAVRSEVKSERLITFYNLSKTIATSLKGLFVLFAGHFINNASHLLDACNKVKSTDLYFEDDTRNLLLLENILRTLNAVFLYDTQKFINKDRFDILMQPLVDQLENALGGIKMLEKRNKELLTPCLVHFSLATADDALWKQMNYQILLKMRHNDAKIRLVTLNCLTEIVKKLGEDFLPLLPETVPFLAELLEDEDENVEKACQKTVQEMEKVLGEPLQKYF